MALELDSDNVDALLFQEKMLVKEKQGKEAVEAFLSELKDSSGKLPAALKGGRVVLLGDPMPPVDACLAKAYGEGARRRPDAHCRFARRSGPIVVRGGRRQPRLQPDGGDNARPARALLAGLGALSEAGLLWEWCCKSESLPAIAKQCANFPDTTFVLDHIGKCH